LKLKGYRIVERFRFNGRFKKSLIMVRSLQLTWSCQVCEKLLFLSMD